MSSYAYKLSIEELPKSCSECKVELCRLPLRCNPRGGLTDRIKVKYLKKRHENCPIFELKGE